MANVMEVFDYEIAGDVTAVYRSHNQNGRVIVDEIEGFFFTNDEDMKLRTPQEIEATGCVLKIRDESDLQDLLSARESEAE